MRISIVSLMVLATAAVLPLAALAAIPTPCPSGPTLLSLDRDAVTADTYLTWSDVGCLSLVQRSAGPTFGPGEAVLPFTPDGGYTDLSFTDGPAATPEPLYFYNVLSLSSEGERFFEVCAVAGDGLGGVPVTLAYDNGDPRTQTSGLQAGDTETAHFIALQPFRLESLSFYFTGTPGPVEIHIYEDWGHSRPNVDADLIPPITTTVATDEWVEIDVSAYDLTFMPHEHFFPAYVHINEEPYLKRDRDATHESHSFIQSQEMIDAWRAAGLAWLWGGLGERNYLIRANGQYFCDNTSPLFTDVSVESGVALGSESRIHWGDVDNDGYEDMLLIVGGSTTDTTRLMMNNGDGTFRDATFYSKVGGKGLAFGVFADVDNDGDLDLYGAVYTSQTEPDTGLRDLIMLNDGSGKFNRVIASGVEETSTTAGAAFGDYDADGNLDLYSGNWLAEYPYSPAMKDFLFRGNGDGTFTDVTDSAGMAVQGGSNNRACYGVAWCDYDNDGDADIFVGNYGRQANFLWENDGAGTFTEVARQRGVNGDDIDPGKGNTFGEDWGDYDNDGDFDLVLTNIAHPRYQPTSDITSINRNNGPPDWDFTDVRTDIGVDYNEGDIEASWVDFDNDGDLDLLVAALYSRHYAHFYRQEADGSFTDISYLAGLLALTATNHAWADYDRDGDLDLALMHRGSSHILHLYRNNVGNLNNWLTVRLEGTDSNRGGIGARVIVRTGSLTQTREVIAGKGHFNSQPSIPVEFGLGTAGIVDELTVAWPSGHTDIYTGLDVNCFLVVEEGGAIPYCE